MNLLLMPLLRNFNISLMEVNPNILEAIGKHKNLLKKARNSQESSYHGLRVSSIRGIMYIAIIWNARGVKYSPARYGLFKLVHQYGVDMLVILELMVTQDNFSPLAASLGFDHVCSNAEYHGKIWLIWNDNLEVIPQGRYDQVCIVRINVLRNGSSCLASFVCVKYNVIERRYLWDNPNIFLWCLHHTLAYWG